MVLIYKSKQQKGQTVCTKQLLFQLLRHDFQPEGPAGGDAQGRSAPLRRPAAQRCLLLPAQAAECRQGKRACPRTRRRWAGACAAVPIEAVSCAFWVPRSSPVRSREPRRVYRNTALVPSSSPGAPGQALSTRCRSSGRPGLQNEVICRALKPSLSFQT